MSQSRFRARPLGAAGHDKAAPWTKPQDIAFDATSPIACLGQYDTPGSTYDVEVVGSYAYVADWIGGFRIADISDPTNPVEVGVAAMDHAHVFCISGGYAYVIDNILRPLQQTIAIK